MNISSKLLEGINQAFFMYTASGNTSSIEELQLRVTDAVLFRLLKLHFLETSEYLWP